jgi:hypothetical protein
VHGSLTLLIGFVCIHIVALLRLPMTEFLWHLPFALFGALLPWTSYRLARHVGTVHAGLAAALLTSLLPLHVAFSRISGEGHLVLATGLQQLCLLEWLRYLDHPTPKKAWAVGLVLALDILTDFFFLGMLLSLVFGTYASTAQTCTSFKAALKGLLQWRISVLALGPLLLQGALAAYTWVTGRPVGMPGRTIAQLRSGDSTVGSLNLGRNLATLQAGANSIFILATVLCIGVYLLRRGHLDRRSAIPGVHSLIYLVPLVFIQRERLIGHYLPVLVSLCVFCTCIFGTLVHRRQRILSTLALAVTALALLLTMLSMVYKIPSVALLETAPEHGAVGTDSGAKAAAWWIRQNTPADALIFGDAFAGQDAATAEYYYRRPMKGLYIPFPNMEASVQIALDSAADLDYLVLGVAPVPHFPPAFLNQWHVQAIITVDHQPTLWIYRRTRAGSLATPPTVLEATTINPQFDRMYLTYPTLVE